VLAALLLFWVIGAYNRLVGLRNLIGEAGARLGDCVQQRAAAVEPLVAALREPMAAEQGALDAFAAAQAESQRATAAVVARPSLLEPAQAWGVAEATLTASAARVLALLEQQPALAQDPAIESLTRGWREGDDRLGFARRSFNEAARTFNEAAGEFPTRLVARAFKLDPAGSV
jgi:LemA protein